MEVANTGYRQQLERNQRLQGQLEWMGRQARLAVSGRFNGGAAEGLAGVSAPLDEHPLTHPALQPLGQGAPRDVAAGLGPVAALRGKADPDPGQLARGAGIAITGPDLPERPGLHSPFWAPPAAHSAAAAAGCAGGAAGTPGPALPVEERPPRVASQVRGRGKAASAKRTSA